MPTSQQTGCMILRLGIAAVFIWFGCSQLFSPSQWAGLVPSWASTSIGLSALTVVFINGVVEVIGGGLLAIGLWVRWAAALLAIHLFVISLDMGLGAIGVRDMGLTLSTIALAFLGSDQYTIDARSHNSAGYEPDAAE